MGRRWTSSNKDQYQINGQIVTKSNYSSVIQTLGLSFLSPINVVQQGKIGAIGSMSEIQLYKVLQEAAGTTCFLRRKDQALKQLEQSQGDKHQIKDILESLGQRLVEIQAEKMMFKQFQNLEQEIQSVTYLLCQASVEQLNERERVLLEQSGRLSRRAGGLRERMEGVQSELEQQGGMLELQQRRMLANKYLSRQIQIQEKLEQSHPNVSEPQIQELKAKIVALNKLSEETLLAICSLTPKINSQTSKEISDNLKAKVRQIDQKIIKELTRKQQRIQGQIKQMSVKINEINQMKVRVSELRGNKGDLSRRKIQMLKSKVEKKAENQHLFKKLKVKLDLPQQIMQLSGVIGRMIHFIQIKPQLAYAYQILGKGKLFTLLVKDSDTARRVSQIHTRSGVGALGIYCMQSVKQLRLKEYSYPSQQHGLPLTSSKFYKIVQCDHTTKGLIDKLFHHFFAGSFISKDYQTALKISKSHSINCVTPERQLSYAQGFMTKVGVPSREDRLTLWFKEKAFRLKMQENKKQIERMQQQIQTIQNQQQKLAREMDSLSLKEQSSLSRSIQQQFHFLQSSRNNIQRELVQVQSNRKQLQDELIRISKGGKSNPTQSDLMKLADLHIKKTKMDSEIVQMNQRLIQLQSRFQTEQQNKAVSKRREKRIQISSGEVEKKTQTSKSEQKLKSLIQSKSKMQYQLNELNKAVETTREKIKLIGKDRDHYLEKIKAIDCIVDEKLRTLTPVQLKAHVQVLRHQQSKKYTARDRLLLEEIDRLCKDVDYHKQKFNNLLQGQERLRVLIGKYDQQCLTKVNSSFQIFKSKLSSFFTLFYPHGLIQSRLVNSRYNHKSPLQLALDIRISFQTGQLRKWTQLSGGQRSVASLCVIFAIQQIGPSPFYIFDQVDAALDYTHRVTFKKLIEQLRKDRQYFITTFKEDMAKFQGGCQYFQVSQEGRFSRIGRVTGDQMIGLLQKTKAISLT